METNETTNETPTEATPETPSVPEEPPQDPSNLGKLTPEEQSALLNIRQQSQQLLAKIGEHELLKARLLSRLEDLDAQGQEHINGISKRLGIEEGQQWVALQDGTIRLVNSGGDTPG